MSQFILVENVLNITCFNLCMQNVIYFILFIFLMVWDETRPGHAFMQFTQPNYNCHMWFSSQRMNSNIFSSLSWRNITLSLMSLRRTSSAIHLFLMNMYVVLLALFYHSFMNLVEMEVLYLNAIAISDWSPRKTSGTAAGGANSWIQHGCLHTFT